MNKLEAARKLQDRTKQFAIQIIRTFSSLPKTEPARIIGRQFLRSGTAVAANYRAACRARSLADFISKLGIVLEETDETLFWLDLLARFKDCVSRFFKTCARRMQPVSQNFFQLTYDC